MIYLQHIWAVITSVGLALKLQLYGEAVIMVPMESAVALNESIVHSSVLGPGASFHRLIMSYQE